MFQEIGDLMPSVADDIIRFVQPQVGSPTTYAGASWIGSGFIARSAEQVRYAVERPDRPASAAGPRPGYAVRSCAMNTVNTVVLVLVVHWLAAPPAQAAEGARDPSRFTYSLLYCTPDANSHFRDVTVELSRIDFAPPAAPIHIGGTSSASSVFFGGFEAVWGAEDVESGRYHPAPAAQFIVVLEGDFAITATDGETRRFRPGSVLRLEDTPPCKGHITVVGDTPGFFLFAR